MFKIDIPKDDFVLSADYYRGLKRKGGVYRFYSKDGDLLYVGISNNLYKRIYFHLNNNEGYSNITYYIRHNFYEVRGFYEEDPQLRGIYESYLIQSLKPLCNKQNRDIKEIIKYVHPDKLNEFMMRFSLIS